MDNQQQSKSGLGGIGEGIKTGLGVLNAFREAIEETLQEAVDRGDLSQERARQAMRDAGQRLQEAFDSTRERLEFVTRREYDELRDEITVLRERLDRMERGGATGVAGESAAPEKPDIIVTD